MAGEGIEYLWGCAKQYYHLLPIKEKRGIKAFRESVNKSLSQNRLTVDRQRMFSRRAREYMKAYKSIERVTQNKGEFIDTQMSHSLIETILKRYKIHRCASDFDSKFIRETVDKMRSCGMR